ncbi:MAG: hypothetical protein JWN78_2855 [Bacteroidota bacterium]|nr:hypothetical protein [Bacteroidota bacterium]
MKKILFSILFTILCISAYSQKNLEEVVYLKNGSIIRGTIIEQIPNETLKIQTRDGSVFVYKFDEIIKITKEPPVKSATGDVQNVLLQDKMKRAKTTGIALIATAGALIVAGGTSFGIGRRKEVSSFGDGGSLRGPAVVSGIALMSASVAFLIAGPIELAKYARLKKEYNKGLSFSPCIQDHHLDGMLTNIPVVTYGAALTFKF